MYEALFVELIGTFMFLSVILKTGKAIPIAVALATVIFWGGSISGGHFNPAVTFVQAVRGAGGMDAMTALQYVIMQLIGGYGALHFYNNTK